MAWNVTTAATARGTRDVLTAIERYLGPDGILARPSPTGSMAFWTTIMLAAYLILTYL